MIGEDLQHVPVELRGLGTFRLVDGSLDELLVLLNTSLVNDGSLDELLVLLIPSLTKEVLRSTRSSSRLPSTGLKVPRPRSSTGTCWRSSPTMTWRKLGSSRTRLSLPDARVLGHSSEAWS